MSNNGKGDAFWALIGKLGAIAGLVVAVIGIFTWFNAPTTALRADIERGKFHLPPRYSEFQSRVEDVLAPESIKTALVDVLAEEFHDKGRKDDDWTPLSIYMSRILVEKAKPFDSKTTDPYRGYWIASIANEGELTVEGVSLRIPEATIAVIDREDGTRAIDEERSCY